MHAQNKEGHIFTNLYPDGQPRALLSVLKHKLFSKNPYAEAKKADTFKMPVTHNDPRLQGKEDFICWLGHASFLLQIDGKRIITDPCLTAPPMMHRHTQLPLPIEQINPDYILVSHGHYDHLDWLIQRFFCLQVAFSHSPRRVLHFRPYLIMNEIAASKIQIIHWGSNKNIPRILSA